ncbi:MAG: biopolymer transporter ExbD [Hyphomonas sp.]
MALKRVTRRRPLSITSLIDVIFLLLLFFMLTSTFSKYSELDIAVAGPGDEVANEAPDVLELAIDAHHMRLDGAVLPAHGWTAALKARLTDNTVVALSIAPEVNTQRMTDVLAELNQVPNLTIYVVETS